MSKKTVAASVNRQQLLAPYDAIKGVQAEARERMERVNRILRESRNAVAAKRAAEQRR
ncbi:hypothetical protein GCM10011487_02120 [Steroidobacter agaridevorans]|uniref:Uncharacterized protein n=1 Tax=Steroidobacter agaridevorans TaxID=2695856 RepID=A0A829Y6I0_9GAMM|nr:hypothetical protein GCM10011487_02120 [Steroidobacter agaridevorans]